MVVSGLEANMRARLISGDFTANAGIKRTEGLALGNGETFGGMVGLRM